MRNWPDNCVDLVITSPPYNCGKEYESNKTNREYQQWLTKRIDELHRILPPKGRLIWNVVATITQNNIITPTGFLNYEVLSNKFNFRDIIIWNQLNSECDTAWGSWKSASSPYIRHQTEWILIFYKESWRKGKGISTIATNEFMSWTRDIWKMNCASRKYKHPAPFPIEFGTRTLKMFSFIDDIILDPFCGSGTTCVAAKMLSRQYIGIDISEKYCEVARQRLRGIKPSLFEEPKKRIKRESFGLSIKRRKNENQS